MAETRIKNAPKRQKVIEALKQYLNSNECPVNGRLPSEMELAEKFEVTRRTLRLALDELEMNNMVERIHGKGTFKCGGSNRSNLIYFLLPCSDWSNIGMGNISSISRLLNGLMAACARKDCRLVTLPFSPTNNPEDIDWDVMRMIEPGALVFVSSIWYRHCFAFLAERNCRVAFLHTQNFDVHFDLDDRERPIFTRWLQLRQDTGQETGKAVAALLRCGCQRPALAAQYLHDITNMRLPGYQQALTLKGKFHADLVWDIPAETNTRKEYLQQLREFYCKTRFDGLIVNLCIDFTPDYRYSLNRNLGLPEEIKIITLYEYEFNALLYPPVPSPRYDFRQIGYDAVTMLLANSSPLGAKVYQPELVNTDTLDTPAETIAVEAI